MDAPSRNCCMRAIGWALVGVVIAVSWGVGNLASGMPMLEAFGIPGLVVSFLLGGVVLAVLRVPWFLRLCACPGDPARGEVLEGRGVD